MQIEPTPTRARVTKAVIPAGGLGARFLPATLATPKEMLPVVDTPAIQYVAQEAVAAGCEDLLIITGPGKRSIEDHFDGLGELGSGLVPADDDRVGAARRGSPLGSVHYVRQGPPLGLGHAVLQAERHVGGHAFVVLLGDDLIDERDPILPRMLDVRARYGGSVVALLEVPGPDISAYGCASVRSTLEPGVLDLDDLVEKPQVGRAPSTLAIIGRYLLDPQVFPVLRTTTPGVGGEIQLTDALRTLAAMPASQGGGVRGVVHTGRRYDTGDMLSYLKAIVQMACERPDLGPEFHGWLTRFTAGGGR